MGVRQYMYVWDVRGCISAIIKINGMGFCNFSRQAN